MASGFNFAAALVSILATAVPLTLAQGEVKFIVHRRSVPPREFSRHVTGSFLESNFKRNLHVKFILHGWLGDATAEVIISLVEAYLWRGDYNVVAVDWSHWANTWNYKTAAEGVPEAAAQVEHVVRKLVDFKLTNLTSVHLVGFSLGAHVAGAVGDAFKHPKLARITGLDPAGFLFTSENTKTRLDPDDADLVDVIHTCGGVIGYLNPLGDLDFYPNGGVPAQPSCEQKQPLYCSHKMAYQFFNESLYKEFAYPAFSHNNWSAFVRQQCRPLAKQIPVYMGHIAPRYRRFRGSYFIATEPSACK